MILNSLGKDLVKFSFTIKAKLRAFKRKDSVYVAGIRVGLNYMNKRWPIGYFWCQLKSTGNSFLECCIEELYLGITQKLSAMGMHT